MDEPSEPSEVKPLIWIGSSRDDLIEFPPQVRKEAGYALYLAQIGMKALKAKPLRGFGGGAVLEIVENYDGNAYRAVYTVKFPEVVFVLHAFQKKSKRGISTPKSEIELVRMRLRLAAEYYQQHYGDKNHDS